MMRRLRPDAPRSTTPTGLSRADLRDCAAPDCTERVSEDAAFCRRHLDLLPESIIGALSFGLRSGKRKAWTDAIGDAIVHLRSHPDGRGETVLITGDTYPVRQQLGEMGFHWSPGERGWRGPRDMKMADEVIVGNAPQAEQLPGLTDDDLGI